jgi:hypothetical protein
MSFLALYDINGTSCADIPILNFFLLNYVHISIATYLKLIQATYSVKYHTYVFCFYRGDITKENTLRNV